jgi:hypothetical protein
LQARDKLAADKRADGNRHLEKAHVLQRSVLHAMMKGGTWKEEDTSTREMLFFDGEKEAMNAS